jgi:hypothetical protein
MVGCLRATATLPSRASSNPACPLRRYDNNSAALFQYLCFIDQKKIFAVFRPMTTDALKPRSKPALEFHTRLVKVLRQRMAGVADSHHALARAGADDNVDLS